jgi:hypothetical protein
MDCTQAREWLLYAEELRPEAAGFPAVAQHLDACPACARLATRLRQLEAAWKQQPLPQAAGSAKAAFLRRLATLPARPAASPSRWRVSVPRWAVAASILFAIGITALLVLPSQEAQAAPGVVDRLLEWNLDLASAATPDQRSRIYTERAEVLQQELKNAGLPAEQSKLADRLLSNGSWLATNDDPLAEADRFTTLADDLLVGMNHAQNKGNDKELAKLARHYQRLTEQGIKANLARVKPAEAAKPDRQSKLERMALKEIERQRRLEELAQRATAASRKELRKAIDAGQSASKRKLK